MTIGRIRNAAVAAVALGVVTAGCAPAPSPAPPSATATAAPAPATAAPVTGAPPAGGGANSSRCTTGELTGSLGPADGAAGSVYRALVLTNTGKRPCTLRGFPGVSYVAGDDGHQVGPAAEMSGERGGDIPLAVGGAVEATLQLVNVLNFDQAVCKPTPVRGLRVYPPGDTASLFVPMEGTGCAGTPPGPQLFVKTVTAP